MSDTDKTQLPNRLEHFVRRFFERLGGTLDFALRRPLNAQARTDLTALLPQIERAVEAKLRREATRPNLIIAPNLIELRYDYETYGQMNDARRAYLEKEIAASLYEYAVNHRYTLLGKMAVKLTFDVFTRHLTIKAAFPDEAESTKPTANATASPTPVALPAASVNLVLRTTGQPELRASFSDRAAVGRSHDNVLCISDASVSSFHAVFTVGANGAIWLTDIGSSNGTFVNGVRINEGEKTIVRNGDGVQFGDIAWRLEL